MPSVRRLAAIMFTDMVGSTALAQTNEAEALRLRDEQEALVRPLFVAHQGREIKSMGDGFLAEFDSALRAVQCAIDIQQRLHERNARAGQRPIQLRIGIHLGDVEVRGSDIFGDSVNVASRVEPLAEPGGICVTEPVFGQVHNKIPNRFEKLAPQELKNVMFPVGIYRVIAPETDLVSPHASEFDRNRIAILPLANFSPSPGDDYFADGLTDEIISTVSGITGLSVISRTSVMRYKQTTKSMTEIGRELKAGKLLEGSVRKSGNRVRITAQLIDAENDAHLWSQSYDGSLNDVFETQSDIARKIAEALKLPSPRAGSRAENPEAHALCLRARTLRIKGTREGNDQALILYGEALKVDPESARAAAGLALCYAAAADWGSVEKTEGYDKARSFARRALELDEALPEAHIALGNILMDDDYPGAEVELKKALSLNPSHADAHEWYGGILRGFGRLEEATEEARRAYELDPVPPSRAFFLCTQYWFAGRDDEALDVATRIVQTEPSFAWAYAARAVFNATKGKREEAYRDLEVFRRLRAEIVYKSLRARIEAHLGNKGEASRLIDEAFAIADASGSPDERANCGQCSYACALIGDSERFFPYMDWMVEHRNVSPGELRDPSYQNMATDPRFPVLRSKLRKAYGISD